MRKYLRRNTDNKQTGEELPTSMRDPKHRRQQTKEERDD
jgi:hypothetical protein